MTLKMIPLNSSNISGAAYEGGNLYLEFVKGAVYEYKDVPEVVFNELCAAESVGKFFHSNIRHNFTGKKVKGVENVSQD